MEAGLREIFCVVDGRKVDPFIVYPDAYERFPNEKDFLAFIERQARSILESFQGARGRNAA
jgi:hypothetical protein